MISAAVLAGYAIGIAVFGPRLLSRLRWVGGSPRLGVTVWCAALWSVICAGGLAVGLALLGVNPVGHLFLELVSACLHGLRHEHGSVSTGLVLGTSAAVGLAAWLLVRVLIFLTRVGSARHRHWSAVALVGRFDAALGVTVVDHQDRVAYCLPGRGGRIVVTSAAVDALTPDQLAAVIAHERAHLQGRHHLLTGTARVAAAALPGVPLAQQARPVIQFLAERIADERACRAHDRAIVASALGAVGPRVVPEVSLGIGGVDVAARMWLLGQPAPTSTSTRLGAWALAAGLMMTPLLMALGPATQLAAVDVCAAHEHSGRPADDR